MSISRYRLLSGLLLPALLAPWAALAQPAPVRGGTAIAVLAGDPSTINPVVTTSFPDQFTGCLVYQGLIKIGADGKMLPELAKSWEISEDGKTYAFTLNPVKWQDGKDFTSEDVKYSLLNISAKYAPSFAQSAQTIADIGTPAPDKVVFTLKTSYGPFLRSLACHNGGAIMPAHLYRGTDALTNPATTTKPVGTGPFMLSDWQRGNLLRFVRNPTYWEPGKPYLDEVVAKVIPAQSSRVQALLAGEVDYISKFYVPVADLRSVRARPDLKLTESTFPPALILGIFNTSRGALADKRVRQALMVATDRPYIVRSAFGDIGEAGVAPFPTQMKWAVNSSIDYGKMYPFDAARAAKLLDEAGVTKDAGGTRLKLEMAYDAANSDMAQAAAAIKAMWRAVDVDVTIRPIERTSMLKKIFEARDFDVTLQVYTSSGDPALGLARIYVTSSIGKVFGNASGYSNPAVDALFTRAAELTDLAERGRVYAEVQVPLAADLPVMTIQQFIGFDVSTAKLNGLWAIDGYGAWNEAWLAK